LGGSVSAFFSASLAAMAHITFQVGRVTRLVGVFQDEAVFGRHFDFRFTLKTAVGTANEREWTRNREEANAGRCSGAGEPDNHLHLRLFAFIRGF